MMWIRDHIQNFTCLGADCPDHCCGGWQVPVSEPDMLRLERYMGSKAKNIVESNSCGLIMKPKGSGCVAQCEAGWCGVHKEFGHEALPLVCASYPRSLSRLGERRELGGFLSCPEIARLVMERPNPQGQMLAESISRSAIDFESDENKSPYCQEFEQVRRDIIQTLMQEDFLLGLFQVGAMVELSPAFFNRTSVVSEWGRLYERATSFDSLPEFDEAISLQIWTKIINLAESMIPASKRYQKPSIRLVSAVSWAKGLTSPTEFLQTEATLWPKFKAMNYLSFRRYLEHDWTVRWYLHAPDLVMHWEQSLFKMSLIRLMLAHAGKNWNQSLVECVYSVERLVEHTAWKTELSSAFRSFRLPMRTLTRQLLPQENP